MICTFYSFKGGVGRSMALANVAEHLYRQGLKVIMVDFDLEAPGLERYFNIREAKYTRQEVLSKRGVTDMLWSYKELSTLPRLGQPSGSNANQNSLPFRPEPLDNFIVPIHEKNGGMLSIIPAGRQGEGEFAKYAKRVRSFDWDEFYDKLDGELFFEWFRCELLKAADVILIDSRTGVTEMSGVCTHHLADVVVIFVAPNQQNLDGTLRIAKSLTNDDLIQQGRHGRQLSLLFVPSRIENSEGDLLQDFVDRFNGMLQNLPLPPLKFKNNAFDYLKVPYVPYYAFLEKVAVRDKEKSQVSRDLAEAFENMVVALSQLAPDVHPLHELYNSASSLLDLDTREVETRSRRIFVSYNRNIEPDASVALQVFQALSNENTVFIDQTALSGQDWADRIKRELRRSDYFVAFLSSESINDEVLHYELKTAHQLAKEQNGSPVILPIRLAYRKPFQYPLSVYLDPLNWSFWRHSDDNERIIDELKDAIDGGHLPVGEEWKPRLIKQSPDKKRADETSFPIPGGTIPLDSPFYIKRQSDRIALEAIRRRGEIISIKGPRQVGKSSLLLRVNAAAKELGKRVVFLDFEEVFNKDSLTDENRFHREFCELIGERLGLETRTDEYWQNRLTNNRRCTKYMEEYILPIVKKPLVLAMDEVEKVFDASFRSDFFGMLRAWHNKGAQLPIWNQLDLVLVTSTEPYQLVKNLNQSPFNVGEIIELRDFTSEQVADFSGRYQSPLDPDREQQLMKLLGGHPFLIHLALHKVVHRHFTVAQLFNQATDDYGPFGDHLRHHLLRIHDQEDLVLALQQVIHKQTCPDERLLFRLHGAGLVRKVGAKKVLPRCQLYADYFRERLDG